MDAPMSTVALVFLRQCLVLAELTHMVLHGHVLFSIPHPSIPSTYSEYHHKKLYFVLDLLTVILSFGTLLIDPLLWEWLCKADKHQTVLYAFIGLFCEHVMVHGWYICYWDTLGSHVHAIIVWSLAPNWRRKAQCRWHYVHALGTMVDMLVHGLMAAAQLWMLMLWWFPMA
ncbi:hypothetical protein BZG36_05450 [Bifiguratus adelaidae]|uniref:TLC domain-containing protein n=1 Tax=Bifiguratus adelaidae TaxID=1938954 RepID=A0A261XTM6_9FUNG|nr:hypothetical protein BZG36_05450 [Bifiguratus adelaidae]